MVVYANALKTQHTPCLVVLRGAYVSLSDAERRLADYILDNPDAVLRASVVEAARVSGVGAGTVTRLCVKIGYSGFAEMKVALAAQLLNPDYEVREALHEDDDPATIIRKVLHAGMQNLVDTVTLLDPDALTRAAHAMISARRIDVYATGVLSSPIAQTAHARLMLLDLPCTIVLEPWQQPIAANHLRAGDVAFAITHAGVRETTADALAIAANAGATAICLTSSPQSLLAQTAHIRLFAATQDLGKWGNPATSRIALYGAVEVLFSYLSLMRHRQQSRGLSPPAE